MKTTILCIVGAWALFMAGRTYERAQQRPVIEERLAAARRMTATPPPWQSGWMHDPERRTALDEPAKPTAFHSR